VAAKQNSLDKPVASTTAPASRFSPTGKNPKNPLFTPGSPDSAEIYFRKKNGRHRGLEKERRMMKQNSKAKEIEQDGNKWQREQRAKLNSKTSAQPERH
jgi:hypothetical protein